jgi:hypothetical protein
LGLVSGDVALDSGAILRAGKRGSAEKQQHSHMATILWVRWKPVLFHIPI